MNVIDTFPKSEAALCRAFVALLEEMPYTAIRVKDIVARSELGRTTFYLHYKDKDALRERLEHALLEGFRALVNRARSEDVEAFRQRIMSGLHPVFVDYFAYLRENRQAVSALIQVQEELELAQKLRDMLTEFDLSVYLPGLFDSFNRVAAQHYKLIIVTSYADIFLNWIRDGMVLSDEVMARLLTAYWQSYAFPRTAVPCELVHHDAAD